MPKVAYFEGVIALKSSCNVHLLHLAYVHFKAHFSFFIRPFLFFCKKELKESIVLIFNVLLSFIKIHSVYFFFLLPHLKAHLFALFSSLPFFRKSFPKKRK